MGHEVHGADLVAVQIDSGGAEGGAVFHGGGDALGQVELISHFVVGVAVAGDGRGGVDLHGLLGAALGQGHGGQRGVGVHQLAVREAAESPIEDFGALPIDVVEVGAQHHEAVGVAVLLGKGDKAAACQGGEAGLHAPDVIAVVGVLGVEHQVGGGNGPLVLVEVGGREGVGQGVGGGHVGLILVAGRGDLGQVFRRGDVAVIVQAVHAGKGGARAAQLLCFGVHLGHKGGEVAVRNVAGDDAGGVVGAGHQQAVEQIDAAHRLADAEVHGAAVGVLDVLELLRETGGDGDLGVHVLAAFEEEQGCHHLGQAGNVPRLPGVLVQDGLAGVQIEEVDRLIFVDGLDGHLVGGKAGERSRDGQREGEGQSGRPAEECGLHERILPKIKSFQQLVPEREKRFFRGLGCGGVQQRFVGKGPIEELGGLAEDVLAVGA